MRLTIVKPFFNAILSLPVATFMLASVALMPPAAALSIRVSQESTAGANDFDNNILGLINPFQTSSTLRNFYQYGNPFRASFNGPVPLTSDASHLFLVEAADGLGLFSVYDKPGDIGGGIAHMQFDLLGDTASILLTDDRSETGTATNGGRTFTTRNAWAPCCTDGVVLGSLDGDWTMFAQFTHLNSLQGGRLNRWLALSAEMADVPAFSQDLVLETGRRVRLDIAPEAVPEPATGLGLAIALALATRLKRNRKVVR